MRLWKFCWNERKICDEHLQTHNFILSKEMNYYVYFSTFSSNGRTQSSSPLDCFKSVFKHSRGFVESENSFANRKSRVCRRSIVTRHVLKSLFSGKTVIYSHNKDSVNSGSWQSCHSSWNEIFTRPSILMEPGNSYKQKTISYHHVLVIIISDSFRLNVNQVKAFFSSFFPFLE